MTVTYPKTETKEGRIGFHMGGTGKPITEPIKVTCPIRFNGKGVSKIQFYLIDKNRNKMDFTFAPSPDPNKMVITRQWRKAILTRAYDPRSHKGSLEKLNEFAGSGIIVWMNPGAQFTIEVKELKAFKK